jgi:PilZ domain-containing protein
MSVICTVIIGAAQHLDSLKQRAGGEGEVLAFTDDHVLAALVAIKAKRPQVITLERLFAATSRGAALINRVKADPALDSAEIRIVSHDGSYSRVSPRRPPFNPLATAASKPLPPQPRSDPAPSAGAAPPAAAPQLDHHGTRRVRRFRMHEGTEVQLDGALVMVADLSVSGAQVISQYQLKPQQRVRMILADDLGMVRLNGSVAWARFDVSPAGARYRAGIEFKEPEVKAVEAFCMRHKIKDVAKS